MIMKLNHYISLQEKIDYLKFMVLRVLPERFALQGFTRAHICDLLLYLGLGSLRKEPLLSRWTPAKLYSLVSELL